MMENEITMDMRIVGITISLLAMWAAIYHMLHTTIAEHPILGWIIIIGIVATHDIWNFTSHDKTTKGEIPGEDPDETNK